MALSKETLDLMYKKLDPTTVRKQPPPDTSSQEPQIKIDLDLSCGYADKATFTELVGVAPASGREWELPDFRKHEWSADLAHYIPKVDPMYVFDPALTEQFLVSMYGGGNKSALLHGDRGTGKSTLPEQLCARLNIPFVRVNMTADSEGNKLLGSVTIKDGSMGWSTGAAEIAAKADGLGCWLQIDEVSAAPAGINMNMQWLLERSGKLYIADKVCDDEADKTVVPENFFKVVATDNTQLQGDTDGGFVGTEVQNVAFLDRFDTAMAVPFPPEAVERKVISSRAKISKHTEDTIMLIAKATRQARQEGRMQFHMSPRATQQVARQMELFGNLRLAFETGYCGKLTPTDAAVVKELLDSAAVA